MPAAMTKNAPEKTTSKLSFCSSGSLALTRMGTGMATRYRSVRTLVIMTMRM